MSKNESNHKPYCPSYWFLYTVIAIVAGVLFAYYSYILGLNHGYEKSYEENTRRSLIDQSHFPMRMTMNDMVNVLQGKTGDALDKAFLESMIEHHMGAVEMAKYLSNAKHPELQKMGQDIIKVQTAEIETMKKWMKDWGYIGTGATTIEPHHTEEHMILY